MPVTIDHLSVFVPKNKVSEYIETYKTVLSSLGLVELARFGGEGQGFLVIGMGDKEVKRPFFWIKDAAEDKPGSGIHLAFNVGSKEQVDAFHAAALKAGWKDNGEPGMREHYAPGYYAAYIIDEHGNNLEAVFRTVPCDVSST